MEEQTPIPQKEKDPEIILNIDSDEFPTVEPPIEEEKRVDHTKIQSEKLDITKFSVMGHIYTNSSGILMLSLDSELDYKQGRWHYIPYDTNAETIAEADNKKYAFEVYCVADKNSQKRLQKLMRRFMPGKSIELIKINN